LYNQEGKLEEWWTNATTEGFKEKQSCIEKQYSCELPPFRKGLLLTQLVKIQLTALMTGTAVKFTST
jgi:predicted metalloendopeptidase